MSLKKLTVVAVASSEEVRAGLYKQLQALDYINFDGVVLELSDAAKRCAQTNPDIIIVDLTGRELDGGLFMQTISMNPEHPCTLFALHRQLDHETIVDAVKRGAKEFVQYPDEAEKLEQALRKYLNFINKGNEPTQQEKKGQLTCLFAAKGGSGVSTAAFNLAVQMKEQLPEGKVALLDMDQAFNNLAMMMNASPSYSIGDLTELNPDELDSNTFKRLEITHETGISLLVCSKSVLDDHDMISPELLTQIIDYLVDKYDHVVVDLPTHVLDPYHQYLVERADKLLLLANLDVPGLARARQYLDLVKPYLNMDKVKLVLNRWNQKAAYGMSNEKVEEQFDYPVYCRLPNDWDICVEASSLGTHIGAAKSSCDLAKAYKQLSELVLGLQDEPSADGDANEGNFITKLFSGMKKQDSKGSTANVVR